MDLHGLMRDQPGDRSTDGLLRGNAWFVCRTDRPMVPYEGTRASSGGPIDRWSPVVHLWGRSTDGPLWFICGAVRPMVMFHRQVLPALFDGPKDCALPMVRWEYHYFIPYTK